MGAAQVDRGLGIEGERLGRHGDATGALASRDHADCAGSVAGMSIKMNTKDSTRVRIPTPREWSVNVRGPLKQRLTRGRRDGVVGAETRRFRGLTGPHSGFSFAGLWSGVLAGTPLVVSEGP